MPQQLIYTSAPRGIVAGRSGYCTVARSILMREALMLQLEKFSHYQHLSLSGGQERPIYSARIVDIRGTRFHVLSRIQNANLDFTGRTNFIAHHLVFTPEELRQLATPPVILREWSGWMKSWTKEPELLENENWAELTTLTGKSNVPAHTWQRVTGDAANGYGLLDARSGASFRVDDQPNDTILELIAESLELLEIRDPRRDFRVVAWNYTFTTSMQEQDNPADFRWRCIHADNPAANRFATPDCRALSSVQAAKLTDEEATFARIGRQPPRFAKLISDRTNIQEGGSVRLEVATDGIPAPAIRWFEIERGEPKELIGQSGSIQTLIPNGRAKRYQVQAVNSSGSADSNVVEITINPPNRPLTLKKLSSASSRQNQLEKIDENPYETLNQRYETAQATQKRKFPFLQILGVLVLLTAIGAVVWLKIRHQKPNGVAATNNAPSKAITVGPTVVEQSTTAVRTQNIPQVPPDLRSIPQEKNSIQPIPLPWSQKFIGEGNGMSQTLKPSFLDGNTFVLTGYGENIYRASDNFFFVHRGVSNSVTFVARLTKADSGERCRSGVMIRESEKADAPFAFIGLSQTNTISFVQRPAAGATCTTPIVTTPNLSLPIWFRLNRETNNFSADISQNGTNWTTVGMAEIPMVDQNYLVGFGVCSGKNTKAVRAEFDNVTVVPTK